MPTIIMCGRGGVVVRRGVRVRVCAMCGAAVAQWKSG